MHSSKLSEIERELTALTLRYTHWADFGEASRLPSLFTEDGIFDSGDLRMVGRIELERGFTIRENRRDLHTRHVCTNMLFEIHDDGTASGVVYLSLYRDSVPSSTQGPVAFTGPTVVGSYHDEYLLVEGCWRIKSRVVQTVFVSPHDVTWSLDNSETDE